MAVKTLEQLDTGTPIATSIFHFLPPLGVDKKADLAGILTALGVASAPVASLGAATTANVWKYATDGRKLGELAGAGTGIIVRADGTNWRTVDQASIVTV